MIPKSDKKRIWALECCRGYTATPVHNPNMLFGLGLVLIAMLILTVFTFAATTAGEAGTVLAIVPNVALIEARKKLEAKQKELEKVFEEAKTPAGELDFRKVACLGTGLTTVAIAEKVRSMNTELNDLHDECMKLVEAEKAAGTLDRLKGLRHPDPDPDMGDRRQKQIKAIGDLITNDQYVQHFIKERRKDAAGLVMNFPDLWPSDILAAGAHFKTLMETTAGWAPESIRIPGLVVDKVTRPIQLLDILPMGQTGMEKVVYMEETTRTHSAAEKAEGVAFAESAFALTERESSVRKITDSLPVTDEQLEDVPFVSSYVNGRLTFGLRQRLDTQVLIGDGSAPNLRGIKNIVGIQTQAKGADPIPDAFFKAMTKLRVTGRVMPTHHIIHPTNWESVRLLRTADGIYIWGNPSEAGPERMWGLQVVQCDIDSAGTGYVISALPQWMSLFERRGIDVQVGYVGDQFKEGKRTIRADMRDAFVVFRPAAICSVTGL